MVPTPVRARALPEAQLCRCTSCSHLVLVPRDRCGTRGGEVGGAYYGRFFRDSEQRAAGVLVNRTNVDDTYHYLFALPAHARPDLPAFEVPLAEAPAVKLRCVFTYLTHLNGLKRSRPEGVRGWTHQDTAVLPPLEPLRERTQDAALMPRGYLPAAAPAAPAVAAPAAPSQADASMASSPDEDEAMGHADAAAPAPAVDVSADDDDAVAHPPGPMGLRNVEWWHEFDYVQGLAADRFPTTPDVPDSYRVEVADARTAILRALETSARGSREEACLWKLLTFFDRLIFAVPRGSRGGVKHRSRKGRSKLEDAIARRLALFWTGQYAELWADAVRAVGGVTDPTSALLGRVLQGRPARRQSPARARAARVARLVAAGQLSRAAAVVVQEQGLQQSPGTLEALRALYPPAPPGESAAGEPALPVTLSPGDRARVEKGIAEAILKAPHRSGAGPSDSRFEHWATLRDNEVGLASASVVLTRLLVGEAPAEAVAAHLGAAVVALPKRAGGVRPIAVGSVLRRLAARGACIAFSAELAQAVGPYQYAVGVSAGCEKIRKVLAAEAELRPEAVILALDFTNAFNSVLRSAVRAAVASRLGPLAPLCAVICGASTRHWYYDSSGGNPVAASRGVDQGCPLSPGFFAVGIAPVLDALQGTLRALDPAARVVSYLDDVYVVIAPAHAEAALAAAGRAFSPAGLTLNRSKCHAWSASGSVPAGLRDIQVDTLKCLGSSLPFVSAAADYIADAQDVPVGSGAVDGALAPALAAHEHFVRNLRELRASGLSLQNALAMHRVFTDGAVTHLLRAGVVSYAECMKWDGAIVHFWGKELGRTFTEGQSAQFFLPLHLGGCGFQSAVWRREAAFLGSWELCFHDVARALGFPAAASFRAACPRAVAAVTAAYSGVAPGQAFGWTQCFGASQPKRQKAYSERVHTSRHAQLLALLSEEDQVDLRSAGGSGAGLFLLPPDDPAHKLGDDHLAVAIRRRLRCSFAAGVPDPAHRPHCNHRSPKRGVCCGCALDSRDLHAACCNVGGGVDHGHNRIRDWLKAWLEERLGQRVATEEFVPGWDRPSPTGEVDENGAPKVERARLDVAYVDAEGRRAYADIAVTSAGTASADNRSRRAAKDGVAAADMVRTKRSRYPAAKLPNNPMTPFVVEALGRLSPEAEGFLRAHAPEDKAERSVVLRRAKQALSVLVQERLAELLLSAEPGRPGGVPVAAAA